MNCELSLGLPPSEEKCQDSVGADLQGTQTSRDGTHGGHHSYSSGQQDASSLQPSLLDGHSPSFLYFLLTTCTRKEDFRQPSSSG